MPSANTTSTMEALKYMIGHHPIFEEHEAQHTRLENAYKKNYKDADSSFRVSITWYDTPTSGWGNQWHMSVDKVMTEAEFQQKIIAELTPRQRREHIRVHCLQYWMGDPGPMPFFYPEDKEKRYYVYKFEVPPTNK